MACLSLDSVNVIRMKREEGDKLVPALISRIGSLDPHKFMHHQRKSVVKAAHRPRLVTLTVSTVERSIGFVPPDSTTLEICRGS